MDVIIRNPLRFRDIKLAEQERLEKIVLEYRKVSGRSPHWNRAKDIKTNAELKFNVTQENSFGYISATWKLPSIEAEYDIRLRSICTEEPTAPFYLNGFISDTVTGVIDRTAPAVFGVPQPSVNLFPGDELAVEFTEDIEVGPYVAWRFEWLPPQEAFPLLSFPVRTALPVHSENQSFWIRRLVRQRPFWPWWLTCYLLRKHHLYTIQWRKSSQQVFCRK